jgi:antitoxin YefM
MLTTINYTQTRDHLAKILDEVAAGEKIYGISRRGKQEAVLMSADEYSSLMTTLHLLRSRNNAMQIFEGLEESEKDNGSTQTLDELREEIEFGKKQGKEEKTTAFS